LLHTAKRDLGLTDDEYRELLYGAAGVRSSSELHPAQLPDVMRMLSKLGFKFRTRKYDDLGRRPGMAEPAQLRLIELIWSQVSHAAESSGRSKGLRRWVLRQAKVADIKFLNFDQAQRVIEGLKKYYTRTHGKPWGDQRRERVSL
jgi:phage gp16-like protein